MKIPPWQHHHIPRLYRLFRIFNEIKHINHFISAFIESLIIIDMIAVFSEKKAKYLRQALFSEVCPPCRSCPLLSLCVFFNAKCLRRVSRVAQIKQPGDICARGPNKEEVLIGVNHARDILQCSIFCNTQFDERL